MIEKGNDRQEQAQAPNPWWKVAMVGIPAFLAVSSVFAMWIWWRKSQDTSVDPRLSLGASAADVEELEDHLYKLSGLVGPREWETEQGRRNMRRAIAFIQSTLSPQNYGFAVETGESLSQNDELWPTIWVDLRGADEPREVILVEAAYDLSDASVSVLLAAANDLRDEERAKTVRFLFYPALLYGAAEGKETTDVLADGEEHVSTLQPDLPVVTEGPPRANTWNGAQLKPIAEALVREVRKMAH